MKLKKLFKTIDDKFMEIGFQKIKDDEYAVTYIRKNEAYDYTQIIDIIHKESGRHIVQSYDEDVDEGACVGLTYYELKLVMRKIKQKGWTTKLPLMYEL